ncbi:MAG: hypothetical protein HY908_17845 [Myxococcales bacterium]|nr:hypothetical protein [Myxococcales bacterium]
MKKVWLVLGSLGAMAAAMGVVQSTDAAGKVTPAVDNCMNAHAVLAASKGGDSAVIWQAIDGVMRVRPHWAKVSDYEPMVAQKISFRQYSVKWGEGITAYVAHCGHGGTCNQLAEAVLKAYPDIGSPVVYCGQVPYFLDNPSSASI